MREIFRDTYTPDYAQIALMDQEDPDAIPHWKTGKEMYALGPAGIVVATAHSNGTSDPVEVTVYEGLEHAPGVLLVSTTIRVGNQGLFVGDPIYPAPSLPWPAGDVEVSVYVDVFSEYPEANVRHLAFVLTRLANE